MKKQEAVTVGKGFRKHWNQYTFTEWLVTNVLLQENQIIHAICEPGFELICQNHNDMGTKQQNLF